MSLYSSGLGSDPHNERGSAWLPWRKDGTPTILYSPPPVAPKATRIPVKDEVWTDRRWESDTVTIVWADDMTVVFNSTDRFGGENREVASSAYFHRNYDPPKPKLPPMDGYLNFYPQREALHNGDGWGGYIQTTKDSKAALHVWVDDDGEPHVERVS